MLSHNKLLELVRSGVIYNILDEKQVQGSSIDVRLGAFVMYEQPGDHKIVLRNREKCKW